MSGKDERVVKAARERPAEAAAPWHPPLPGEPRPDSAVEPVSFDPPARKSRD